MDVVNFLTLMFSPRTTVGLPPIVVVADVVVMDDIAAAGVPNKLRHSRTGGRGILNENSSSSRLNS